MHRLHLKIHGLVQGVFYRATAQEEGTRLGLTGWIRNCPNGCVEIVAEGARDHLTALRDWCRKGPPAARVDELDETWSKATGEFTDFGVHY